MLAAMAICNTVTKFERVKWRTGRKVYTGYKYNGGWAVASAAGNLMLAEFISPNIIDRHYGASRRDLAIGSLLWISMTSIGCLGGYLHHTYVL